MSKEQLEPMRLNKFISYHTKYSRREADQLIKDGKVTVNKQKVVDMGMKVIPKVDKVSINDKKDIWVEDNKIPTVIVYNKPKGELVTKKDPQNRKTIYDTLGDNYKHYMPIGRLDYASEGVLLLSDTQEIVNALMHSSLERIYKIKINGYITKSMIDAMENGIEIQNSKKGAHKYTEISTIKFAPFVGYQIQKNDKNFSKIKIILNEGKNRELRRFFAHFGSEVLDLKRIEFGGISLNNLPTGKKRFLTREEYRDLRSYIKAINKEV